MITSSQNPRIKDIIQLQKKSRLRKERGVFIVEGPKMFREAPKELIESVFISEQFAEKEKYLELTSGLNCEVVTSQVMKSMSDTVTPQGILSVIQCPKKSIDDIIPGICPKLLLLDGLSDPGNAGTILRTAEGAGIDAVILENGSVDFYNPKTIRSTMGAIFRVPFVYASLADTIIKLRERKVPVYSADMNGVSYREAEYKGGFAFIIGNESNGVRKEIKELCDSTISIPMHGSVESLNAAIAAALIMYEGCHKA